MAVSYLPKLANITETCAWLGEQTGESWTLARLMEFRLHAYFWIDYSPTLPIIFGDKIEGYLAPIIFNGDIQRLEAEGKDALVNMTKTHDGKIFKANPPIRITLDEIRFKREEIQRLSTIFKESTGAVTPPKPQDKLPESTGLTKRAKQVQAIVTAIPSLGFQPMNIPTGGKTKIREWCKENHSDIFGAGDDPFKEAWQKGVDEQKFRMKDHNKFKG